MLNRSTRVFAPVVIVGLLSACGAPRGVTGGAASATSQVATPDSVPVGDPSAIARCQAAEEATNNMGPLLTVMAGYVTTIGAAHRYFDVLALRQGGPSQPPAIESDAVHSDPTTTVLCILDGQIEGPRPQGVPPYTRELALVNHDGSLEGWVFGSSRTIPLAPPAQVTSSLEPPSSSAATQVTSPLAPPS